ncbi:MAG: SDR family oxidoreductase, partial [Chloroflexi bacterium]|nr:SDR family oxidoreductase [Chloroflexota bacterium]
GQGSALGLSGAGAKIVIGDLQDSASTVEQITSAGGEAVSMVMDTSNPDDAKNLVQFAIDSYGRLDILVNNAAIDAPDGNAWDLPGDEWRRTIDVNLSGVFYCSQAALQPMLAQKSGCIVSISSRSAQIGAKGMSPAYNASKAGVLGLTMSLSTQVSDQGVRVNAIMPSLIESRDFGWTPEERAERISHYPLGVGMPKDVGEAVRYLVSPAARWVSGTALQITGGYQH